MLRVWSLVTTLFFFAFFASGFPLGFGLLGFATRCGVILVFWSPSLICSKWGFCGNCGNLW